MPSAPVQIQLRIQLFGGLHVTWAGQAIPLSLARAPKLGTLLAFLALPETGGSPNAPVRRQRIRRRDLILQLWPEEGDSSETRTRLRTLLLALRRKLEPAGSVPGSVLVTRGEAVFLTEAVVVDVDAFLDALSHVGRLSAPAARGTCLLEALPQMRGVLLPDVGDAWAVSARQFLADRFVESLAETAAGLERIGEEGVEKARHLLQSVQTCACYVAPCIADPAWHDRLHCALMRLHLRARQPAQALVEYAALATRLEGWRVAPSPAALDLRKQAQQAGLAQHPGRPRPPLFGREQALGDLTRQLAALPPLVVLTGPPGAGKTRLALEVMQGVRDTFGPSVCLVRLQDLTHGDRIPHAILRSLGAACPGPDAFEEAVRALSAAPCLLVLDNLEHLLSEGRGGADMVRALLRRVPTLTCLVTSRERLPPGPEEAVEAEFRVTPLPFPPETASWEELRANPGVRLFAERARRADPDFALTRQNGGDVGRLCRLLDGLPLALVLVAEWVRTHTPARMAKEIRRLLREPSPRRKAGLSSRLSGATEPAGAGGAGGAPYATLQAALAWSYALLDAEAARLFNRLSVFRGGWTLEVAEVVCGGRNADTGQTAEDEEITKGAEVTAGLVRLLDASLVEVERVDTGETQGDRRFTLLATLRQFGAEQLGEAQRRVLAGRHAAYFLRLAEEAAPGLLGAEQGAWLHRLEADHANFLAALDACTATGLEAETPGPAQAETGLRLCAALSRFWWTRGYLDEGSRRCASVLALATAQAPTKARADALYGAGTLAWMQGYNDTAQRLLEECLAIREGLGDARGSGAVFNSLGILARRQGDYDAALRLLEACLGRMQAAGDRQGIAGCYGNLGNVAKEQGDYALACRLHGQSLALHRALEDQAGIATCLHNLALAHKSLGEYARARLLYAESLAQRRELGDRQGVADTLGNLGNVAEEQGDYVAARQLQEEALQTHREIGNRQGIAKTLGNLGTVAWRQGDHTAAQTLHLQGLALHREVGQKADIAISLGNLGQLACEHGEYAQAFVYWAECLPLAREIGDQETLVAVLEGCVPLAVGCGQTQAAVRLHAFASHLRVRLDVPQPPNQQGVYAQVLRQVQAALSAQAFAQAYAEGENMTPEQAIAGALGLEAFLPNAP